MDTSITLRLQAKLGDNTVTGSEGNKIRVTKTVVCAKDGDEVYDDDCLNLPKNTIGMRAKYTVFLEHVSPDTSVPLVAVYDQLPSKFDWDPVADPVDSLDDSFLEIETTTPTNIGSSQDQIWKWDFSSSPISFVQGEIKQFTFIAEIDKDKGEYCNRAFLKMQSPPHESSAPFAGVWVKGGVPQEGCANGGTVVSKYVDKLLILPNQTNIVTYIVNVENVEKNSQQIDLIKDVLPQGGFLFCNGVSQGDPLQTCDPPMFKMTDTNFDPLTDSFTDTTGYTNMADPVETYDAVTDRWDLVWDAGWSMEQAGKPQDVFIMRFQTEVTPLNSGSYFNEIFIDVNCSVPSVLFAEGVTTQDDYCASYSWPAGGAIVPTYDIGTDTPDTWARGNLVIDWGLIPIEGQLNSWHVGDQ